MTDMTPEQAARTALRRWVADGAIAVLLECPRLQVAEVAFLAGYDAATIGHVTVPANVEAVLGVREAAERLGVSRQRVDQLIRAGLLPSQRVGAQRVVRVEDVDAPAVQQRNRTGGRPKRPTGE